MRAAPPARAAAFSRCSCPLAPAPRLPLPGHRGLPTTVRLSAPASRFARSVSLHVETTAAALAAPPCRRGSFLRHGESASAGSGSRRGRGRLKSKSGRTDAISASVELQNMNWKPELILCRQQVKTTRWKPIYALETGGSPSPDGQDFEDNGFLGRTRLGRIIQAAARELLQKLNSARTNSPTKIFLVLLGFYTANALATILGQTGDWDVLVAGIVVAAIEGIGMLMYKKPVARPPGRFQSLIAMINYWKAGVCLGLFVDAFKLGS